MTLDLQRLATASPLLRGEGLISICEAAGAIGLSELGLVGELRNHRAPVFVHAQQWRGWYVPDWSQVERDHDSTFVLNSVEALGERKVFSGVVRPYDSAVVLSLLLTERQAVESVFHLDGGAAFWRDDDEPISLSAWMVTKNAVEHIRSLMAGHLPPASPEPLAATPLISLAAPTPPQGAITLPVQQGIVIADTITAKHGHKRFSELFATYQKHRQWGEDQNRRMETESGLFIGLMGDLELSAIELETIHEFADRLSRLPTDIYQARRRLKVEALQDLMAIAEREGLKLKNEKTVKGHVARIGEVLNFADEQGMMHANPASGFKRSWGSKRKARAQDARSEFAPEDLQLIFSQEWYKTGAGKFHKSGFTYWSPFYYWLPLLGLTSGGRLNELAQLYLDDIRKSEKDESVWYLDFNLDQPDKQKDDDDDETTGNKSLKTANAFRVVPLHPAILNAGLLDYVNALRNAGEQRLFPELKADPVKGYGKPAGSWFNERFLGRDLGLVRDSKKSFHSLRHNFITAIERLDATERVQAQLAGHERGKTESGTRYTKDRTAAELHGIIARLEFPCLSELARFDVQAGLKALGWAKRRKLSHSGRGEVPQQ